MDDPSSARDTLGPIVFSSDLFRKQMNVIAREYNPVSIADVYSFLRGEKQLPRRAVAVTFDDGYADNLEVAEPVLAGLGIRATFYVAVGSVDSRKLPWPARLRYAFYQSKKNSWLSGDGITWPFTTFEHRDRAFLAACDACCQLAGEPQEDFVKRIERELESEMPTDSKQLMMKWDQVRELARRGHIIGSHTVTHPNMAYVNDAALRSEFVDSKRRLEEELAAPATHFCYPRPAMSAHWSERTVDASREAGYQTAATLTSGSVRRGDDPLSLRRIWPTKQVDGLRWTLESIFAGRRYR
jgi:peptidoglycan/xylan/chitin deacetylase (PgdA/CDA1 family)